MVMTFGFVSTKLKIEVFDFKNKDIQDIPMEDYNNKITF